MTDEGGGTDGSEVRSPESDDLAAPRTSDPGPRTSEAWVAALRDALLTALSEDDVDITAGAEPGVLEVSTDDWTLRVEGLTGDLAPSTLHPQPATLVTAWLAIDDEPEGSARYRAARRAVMSPAIDRALARADAALDGALRAALVAGADPFTQDLVAALHSPLSQGETGLRGG